jgi:hypothetical protein
MRAVAVLALVAACGRVGFTGGTPARPAHSTLALDRVAPGEPVADFPLLVVLDDTRADRSVLAPDASDLRFTAANGMPLAFELEQVGAAGGAPLVAWVRVPSIPDASVTITASYGDDSAAQATGAVWSDAYEAVWHMTGTAALIDSTAHHRDGVATGTTEAVGQIATARSFDAAAKDWIAIADGASIEPAAMSLSAWIYLRSPEGIDEYFSIVTREQDDSGMDDFFLGTALQRVYGDVYTDSGPNMLNGSATTLDTWLHLAFTWDGSQMSSYLGATATGPQPATGTLDDSVGLVYIGADRNNDSGTSPPDLADANYIDGMLDEIRIENVARDAAWVAYDLASQQDAIISYGPVER